MPVIHVVDLFHGDDPVDFNSMKDAGAVGVILKATQGDSGVDSKFAAYYERAITVFDPGCVHSYHFLDNSDPSAQIENYLSATAGKPGRWLDYERNPDGPTCELPTAILAWHTLADKQGSAPGTYGADADLFGAALDQGHFTIGPVWVARYRSQPPTHSCDLWQFAEGEPGEPTIAGKGYDVSQFMNGDADACKAWMKRIAEAAS